MSLLAPLYLLGALAAAVPVVLHLLKRHPEALVRFSAVRLLKSAPVEHASRRHLRELFLLALRVAALLVLALAFSRPFFAAGTAVTGRPMVIALDTSLSMSAAGVFARARALASDAIDRAPAGTALAVLTFGATTESASGLSTDRALARAAVANAQPTAGATRYRAAVAAAVDRLEGHAGTVVMVTDLQRSGWEEGDRASIPADVDLQLADVGVPASNLAVVAATVSGDRLAASVRNASAARVDARVRLVAGTATDTVTGQPRGELRVPVDAGQSAEIVFPRPDGLWASVAVDDTEGAASDNVRYVVLDGPSRPKILVVTATGDLGREALYVEQALIASTPTSTAAYDAVGVAAAALQSWDQPRLDAFAAVVLLSTRGLDHHGRELLTAYLQNGGGLLMAAGPELDGDAATEIVGGRQLTIVSPSASATAERTLASADGRHPVLRAFTGQQSLGSARFQRVASLRTQGCQTLVRFSGGEAALVECETGRGRTLVLASDLDNRGNDFPVRATFLPFVHEAMKYLGGRRRSSALLVDRVPEGVRPIPGIAVLPTAGGEPVIVAVNADPAESDPARLTPDDFQSAIARVERSNVEAPALAAAEQEAQQHLWQYALLALLAVLVAESAIAMKAA